MDNELLNKKNSLKILISNWNHFTSSQRKNIFSKLDSLNQEIIWMNISSNSQIELYDEMPVKIKPAFIHFLRSDDIAKLILNLKVEMRTTILNYLEPSVLCKVKDSIASTQNKTNEERNMQFIRLEHDMTAKEAISHTRQHMKTQTGTIFYAYVVDNNQKLLGIIPWKELTQASSDKPITELIKADFLTIAILSRFIKKPTFH
jgi:magnesium transporter